MVLGVYEYYKFILRIFDLRSEEIIKNKKYFEIWKENVREKIYIGIRRNLDCICGDCLRI